MSHERALFLHQVGERIAFRGIKNWVLSHVWNHDPEIVLRHNKNQVSVRFTVRRGAPRDVTVCIKGWEVVMDQQQTHFLETCVAAFLNDPDVQTKLMAVLPPFTLDPRIQQKVDEMIKRFKWAE